MSCMRTSDTRTPRSTRRSAPSQLTSTTTSASARGDRVALAMRNYPEWVIGHWATISVGAAVVGMNAWWTGEEMEYTLNDSRPKVLIADGERLERAMPHLESIRKTAPLHVITVRTDADLPGDAARWADVVDPSTAPAALPPADIDPDDDALILYTSGTSGVPKGAQIMHRGAVHNVFHLRFWMMVVGTADAKAAAAAEAGEHSGPLRRPHPTKRCSWRQRRCSMSPPATACSIPPRSPEVASSSRTSGRRAERSS